MGELRDPCPSCGDAHSDWRRNPLHCGAALIQNTGKGGTYHYYACSTRLKQGPMACEGLHMPMDKLDGIVLGEVS